MTASPPTMGFQWVLSGARALRMTSGSGRENRFRLCDRDDDLARAANFEGFFADDDWTKEVDRREEAPFFVARRVAAAAENMVRVFFLACGGRGFYVSEFV